MGVISLKTLFLALVASAGVVCPMVSRAEVTYTFQITDWLDPAVNQGFVYKSPDLITSFRLVSSAEFESCSAGTPPAPCTWETFSPDSTSYVPPFDRDPFDVIGFEAAGLGHRFYYFSDGAFSTSGTYASLFSYGSERVTLTVTASAVPELPSYTLAALGIAVLGLARRRGRNARIRS